MFNFNTNKRRVEPMVNADAIRGDSGGQNNDTTISRDTAMYPNMGVATDDNVAARVNEIEEQRKAFMSQNPDFDIRIEMENPDFKKYLIINGLSVEEAYFLAHREEIMENYAGNSMSKAALRRNRIYENGAGKNSPAVVRKNPKDLSDKEIDSIIERVNNGEKISF